MSSFCIVAALFLFAFASWPGAEAQDFNQNCTTTCSNTTDHICDTNRVIPVCRIQQSKGCNSNSSDPGCVAGATCNENMCRCTAGTADPGSNDTAPLCMAKETKVTGACAATEPNCTDNAECSNTTTNTTKCACKTNYQPNYLLYTCEPIDGKVGGQCSSKPCTDAHAMCGGESKKCSCNVGYIVTTALTCVPAPGRVGGACNATTNCSDANAQCTNNVCVCKTDYITSDADATCELDYDSECTIDDEELCKDGSRCDPLLLHCSIEHEASCKNNTDLCVSGATCKGDVCQCNTSISDVSGGLCSPKEGMIGAQCSDSKPCKTNAECNSTLTTCVCQNGFLLDPASLTCEGRVSGELGDITEKCLPGGKCNDFKFPLTCDPEADPPICRIKAEALCGDWWYRNHCVAGSWCSPFLGPEKCQCYFTRTPNLTSGLCQKDGAMRTTANPTSMPLITAIVTSLAYYRRSIFTS